VVSTNSQVEKDAQSWHDTQRKQHLIEDEFGSCWCCCMTCTQDNPHFKDALAALTTLEDPDR
jgi:hypothetical protein